MSGLAFSCEKKNIYPKLGMTIFKTWILIFAFVSSQLSWNLRPFVGNRDLPFELFRARESNFYIAVIYSVRDIFYPAVSEDKSSKEKSENQNPDGTIK